MTTVTRATAEPLRVRVRRTVGADGSAGSAGAVSAVATGTKAAGAGSAAGVSSTSTAAAKAVPAEVLRRGPRLPLPSDPVTPLPLAASDCAVAVPTGSDVPASASDLRPAGEAVSW